MLHTQVGLGSTAVTAAVALRQPNFLQQTVGFTVIDKDGVWLTDSWGGGGGVLVTNRNNVYKKKHFVLVLFADHRQ